jgi:hypothetical protein
MRVELCNYDEVRQHDPSVINMRTDTEMVVDSMAWGEDASSSTWVELIRGAVRTFFKGFGRDSGFSFRAGMSVCGIRGSDVFIGYDPTDESVAASVLEGHMDVTSSRTGKTESLTALQTVLVQDGEIGEVRPFTEEQWSIMVKAHGVENMQGLSSEEREALWSQAQPSEGSLVPVITAGVVLAAAIGVSVILLTRRRHRTSEAVNLPGDGAAAFPRFCRHCGSVTTPGSSFCEGCGERLGTAVPPSSAE